MNPILRAVIRRVDRTFKRPISLENSDGESWDKDVLGREGERLAARWLELHGMCRILRRNFRADDGGEVDVVCRHRDTLVFAEVKTRTSDLYGRPAAAVTEDKRTLILRGAREWLRMLGHTQVPFRFDIVEIILISGQPPDVNWLQGAFTLDHPWQP
jgi:putative endonuclease